MARAGAGQTAAAVQSAAREHAALPTFAEVRAAENGATVESIRAGWRHANWQTDSQERGIMKTILFDTLIVTAGAIALPLLFILIAGV